MSSETAQPPLSKDPSRRKLYEELLSIGERASLSVADLWRLGATLFKEAGLVCDNSLGSPSGDAKYLTHFALKLPYYEDWFMRAKVAPEEARRVFALFEERIERRVPAQYLTREAWYAGYYFYVDENVLVPRSLMAGYFDDMLKEVSWVNNRVLDLCAGSGCIGITLALKKPDARVDLVDVSKGALSVARKNIERFGLQDRVQAVESDLFANVQGLYSLIISNPPYVSEPDYERQAPEYKHEPPGALLAGPDGLDFALAILREAPRRLTSNGTLIVEVGYAAERLLKERYPRLPFRWWYDKGRPLSGVFSLTNGYPLP